jgi:hypothetical protein
MRPLSVSTALKTAVCVKLHVAGDAARGTLERVQLGVLLATPVCFDDFNSRPGGVVVKSHPTD